MSDPIHSTGRGGAGNIVPDPHTYEDGEIVHTGVAGASNKPEFSTGRGGAGNIVESPSIKPTPSQDADVVPQTALREHQEDFHTGRGGEGNVHRDKFGGHTSDPNRLGVGDKVKKFLGLGAQQKDEKGKAPAQAQDQAQGENGGA